MTDAPDLTEPRRRARDMAYSLGIAFYLAPDGTISQAPPLGAEGWERIEPPANARPAPLAHGRLSAAASAP